MLAGTRNSANKAYTSLGPLGEDCLHEVWCVWDEVVEGAVDGEDGEDYAFADGGVGCPRQERRVVISWSRALRLWLVSGEVEGGTANVSV